MNPLVQIAVQVPAFALLCLVVWKLGVLVVTKWAEGDAARTKGTVEAFARITERLDDHHGTLVRVETKLDQALDVRATVREAVEEASGVHDAPDWSPKTPASGYPIALGKRKPTRGG